MESFKPSHRPGDPRMDAFLARHFVDLTSDYPQLESLILELFDAERLTLYQRTRDARGIVSRYKTGHENVEIRVPLSTSSIAGFAALTQQSLCMEDVYDSQTLRRKHPDLRFDASYDQRTGFRTRSMIVAPIMDDTVLRGVFQIINKRGNKVFTPADLRLAQELARWLAARFHDDLAVTDGPYAHLIQLNLLSQEQLGDILGRATRQNLHPANLLIEELRLAPELVGQSLELFYQVPYQPYDPALSLATDKLALVKPAYLRNMLCVPLQGAGEEILLLLDDPSDYQRVLEIQQVLKLGSLELRVSLPGDILRFLGVASSAGGPDIRTLVGQLEEDVSSAPSDRISDADHALDENAAPIIQLVNKIITDAAAQGASDIHIEPGREQTPTRVRFRIDGLCREILQIPASHSPAVLSRLKIMARLDISERRKPQDGKFKLKIDNHPVDIRVATLPTVNGESAVLRLLTNNGCLPLDRLSLSERNRAILQELMTRPHGLFLVAGPTGSGKTTTLHAILNHLNTPDRKIWTAEDPVEITQPGLQQVQVLPRIGFDFNAAMRAFLRADPDVILIGEMRDRETAHTGMEASLTGHLVLSTLHTNSAPETITRLLELGLDPFNFADALLGILAQRLVRTLCPRCKTPYHPEAGEIRQLTRILGEDHPLFLDMNPSRLSLHRAMGCAHCGGTGYRGRMGIHELLVGTPAMRELIATKTRVSGIRTQAIQEGMHTLLQDGAVKIIQGHTDMQQLLKVAAI